MILLLTLPPASVLPAVASDELAERIAACTRERDDALRLSCFDRAAELVAPAATDPTKDFGVQGSELARSRNATSPPREATPRRIEAKVASIEKRPRGELVVALDNGQVWAQKEVAGYFPLDVGDPVAIVAGTLGSHRLIAGKRATPVTRIR